MKLRVHPRCLARIRSARRGLLALAFAGLVGTQTGCLSRPPLVKESFALTVPAATETTPAPTAASSVLTLKSITVAPLFEGKALVYRRAENTWEQDPYAEFLVPPARMFSAPLRTALRRSEAFRDVVEPGSVLVPDRVAEIQVTELYGDFRSPAEPTAILALRCTLISAGAKPESLLQKEYSRRLPLTARTADALVAGWNEALAQILLELAADVSALRN